MTFYYVWLDAGINSPKFISSLLENLICLIVIIKQHHMQMSPVFFRLNLLSISSDWVFVFWGEERGWLLGKGVCVRWHPRLVRETANPSTRDTKNPLPRSGCENLQEIKSKAWKNMIWEAGKCQERNHPKGCAMGRCCLSVLGRSGARCESFGRCSHAN